ncbi:phosphopantetheine-binding protein [Vibrio sp. Of14-4]|uniref:phosphopantetheine-binding protein n=1 Tax=Vibrio sp. Of14-4 TaxID=2724878 RepID=UPI001EF34D3F|nr:phosphopantetheine-binding protein [Vibrio sp. Of14-4]MCG7491070.1 phosphopantetheine-binding protein [Vibrio sp. Of14-4]
MYINEVATIVKKTLVNLPASDKLSHEDNLYNLGMTSLMSVNLMVELEAHFNFHFPHTALNINTFQSIKSIDAVISEILSN